MPQQLPKLLPTCPREGCGLKEFGDLITNLLNFLVVIAVPLAVIIFLYGGFLLLTSRGSEDQIKAGKAALWAAGIGLVIVFGSYIITCAVIKSIFGLSPGGILGLRC